MSEHNLPTDDDAQNDKPAATDGGMAEVSPANTGEVGEKSIDDVNDDAGPLEQLTGNSSGERQMNSDVIHNYLADKIYGSNSVFYREFTQNSETAGIRACKALIKHHPEGPGEDWLTLTRWIDAETGETRLKEENKQKPLGEYTDMDLSGLRRIEVPRKLSDIVAKARELGYNPNIEVDVYHDERRIEWRDNGIGMTAYEVDNAFNVTGDTGVGDEADTGGAKGMGALTFKNLTGKDGGMTVTTRTRLPLSEPNVSERDYDGIKFYAYLGGWKELENDNISDGFKGTKFEIPVQESFNLHKSQRRMKKYTSGLRVPVLYQEHEAGKRVTKEEYGNVDLISKYDDPAVVIDRPGEFTAVAGPNVSNSGDNTWLISMPIKNNAGYLSSMWDIAVQLHDEQGRIVMGPNRGYYHSNGTVYKTEAKEEKVGELDDDDIPLPEPTADRDRLENNDANDRFFRYLENAVERRELETVSDLVADIGESDQAVEAIRGKPDQWTMLRKLVSHHGPYNVLTRKKQFVDFMTDNDAFPDLSDETASELYELFQAVSVAPENSTTGRKKKNRKKRRRGYLMANDPDEIYMAASTGGAFIERKKVVENTHDSVKVVVLSSASEYQNHAEKYGWKLLKEVPRTQSDDHQYNVPDNIHNDNIKKKGTTTTSSDTDDGEGVEKNLLKIRTSSNTTSIDVRKTIEELKEKCSADNPYIDDKRNLVLFPRGGANISNHYSMAKYAAIASCSKSELEELHDFSNVYTYSEFVEQSKNTVIATEEGGYTAEELVELTDDRLVVLCYAKNNEHKKLLKDDDEYYQSLRSQYAEDIQENRAGTYSDDAGIEKETLFAVADKKTLSKACYALDDISLSTDNHLIGLRWSYSSPISSIFNWYSLRGDERTMKLRAKTPNWANDSDVYDYMPHKEDDVRHQFYMGLHDQGIDPAQMDADAARQLIETCDVNEVTPQ